MPDHPGFLKDILERPNADAPRLVYADWLDEHDEPLRAEFIRLQIVIARAPEPEEKTVPGYASPALERMAALRRREQSLLQAFGLHWADKAFGDLVYPSKEKTRLVWDWEFRRGFIEGIACSEEFWLECGPTMVARQPLRWVKLEDKEPSPGPVRTRHAWFHPDVPGDGGPTIRLHPSIFKRLEGFDGAGSGSRCKWYESREAALDALSSACLGWAWSADGQNAAARAGR